MSTSPNFTNDDLKQLKELGISEQEANAQVDNFISGFPFAKLVRPCIPEDGIIQLSEKDISNLTDHYSNSSEAYKIFKFVPASGAASRMFKDLFSFAETKDEHHKMRSTVTSLSDFAFHKEVLAMLKDLPDGLERDVEIANLILNAPGLNYGHLPKGLILFHKYADKNRTAFEEHLIEGVNYSKDANNEVNIHFTVSPEHMEAIKNHINASIAYYADSYGCTFNITYSTQKESTNTIAVDMDNKPFREEDGSILFRPGGHGALLENLNQIDADIVFVKNIDNVVPDRLKDTTYSYKKALAGLLMDTKALRDSLLGTLHSTPEALDTANAFIAEQLKIPNTKFDTAEEAFQFLNRPIRICGMVKNEGEPGGGPFWIENSEGEVSPQIIETSQIDESDDSQLSILKQSTHFNPVDLICAITDHTGEKYDLMQFRDPKTGFITTKSKNGRELKAQELPGLWNGAMANWLTLFVEVPLITFNPVKTINDLLRKEHQPE